MKNAVTDTHVGAQPSGWDSEGFADVRHKAGLDEDVAPRHRGKHKKQVPVGWADFRIGAHVVATRVDFATGYCAWFLCRVVDAYAEKGRWGDDGRVFVVVEETNAERYDYLVGHLRALAYHTRRDYSGLGLSYASLTSPARFRQIPRDLVKKAAQ